MTQSSFPLSEKGRKLMKVMKSFSFLCRSRVTLGACALASVGDSVLQSPACPEGIAQWTQWQQHTSAYGVVFSSLLFHMFPWLSQPGHCTHIKYNCFIFHASSKFPPCGDNNANCQWIASSLKTGAFVASLGIMGAGGFCHFAKFSFSFNFSFSCFLLCFLPLSLPLAFPSSIPAFVSE